MPNHPSENQKSLPEEKFMNLKERRKWDGLVMFLLFFFAFIASVLFNVLVESEPLIANKGF